MTDPEFTPHLAALVRCVEEGFKFREITDGLHGFRVRAGAFEIVLIRDMASALAARYRMSELDNPGPASALWSADGAVADVVAMLLSLPSHGERGAPSLARTGTHLRLPR
jgi:hypothetical protein